VSNQNRTPAWQIFAGGQRRELLWSAGTCHRFGFLDTFENESDDESSHCKVRISIVWHGACDERATIGLTSDASQQTLTGKCAGNAGEGNCMTTETRTCVIVASVLCGFGVFVRPVDVLAGENSWCMYVSRDEWPRSVAKNNYGTSWTTPSAGGIVSSSGARVTAPARTTKPVVARSPSAGTSGAVSAMDDESLIFLCLLLGWGVLASFWVLRNWVTASQ
jgi:hypothetical protein